MARVYWTVFAGALGPHADELRAILIALGAVTALWGGVMCYAQRHLKRLLAFSTISHVGVIVCGIGLLTAHGLAGAAVYVVGQGFTKGALFMLVGVLLHRFGTSTSSISTAGGAARLAGVAVRHRRAGAGRHAGGDAVLRQVAARRRRARAQLPLAAHGVRDLLDSHRRGGAAGRPGACSSAGAPSEREEDVQIRRSGQEEQDERSRPRATALRR